MDKVDIPFLSATELSRLLETKEVSPVEATEAYLERIDGLDCQVQLLPHRVRQRSPPGSPGS